MGTISKLQIIKAFSREFLPELVSAIPFFGTALKSGVKGAFDKMDDERIVPMMEFFNSLELQVIMATPPQKIEIIGEHVDTVLTAIRTGESSIVEEYEFY